MIGAAAFGLMESPRIVHRGGCLHLEGRGGFGGRAGWTKARRHHPGGERHALSCCHSRGGPQSESNFSSATFSVSIIYLPSPTNFSQEVCLVSISYATGDDRRIFRRRLVTKAATNRSIGSNRCGSLTLLLHRDRSKVFDIYDRSQRETSGLVIIDRQRSSLVPGAD